MKRILFCLALAATPLLLSAQKTFVRTPALSPNGETILFSYQGDIWKMALPEGTPVRLTLHEAYEHHPVFSPNGQQIAFSGARFGNDDLYTLDLKGGIPQRLTYHSAGDALSQWTSDDELIFTTDRAYQQVERDDEIYRVSVKGGTPQRIMNALGEMPVLSPDGKRIAFVRGACKISRENYRGPANNEIWIYEIAEDRYTQVTNNEVNDFLPRWHSNGELFYLRARDGRYAVVRQNIAKSEAGLVYGDAQQGIHYFDLQGDRLIMAQGQELLLMDLGEEPQKISVEIPTDYRFYPVEKKTYRGSVSDYRLSPDGRSVALEIHGEIFVGAVDKEESYTVNLSDHPYYDRDPAWLNDSLLLFSSDRSNNSYNLYQVSSTDPTKSSLLRSLKHQVETQLERGEDLRDAVMAPNGKKIAFTGGRNKLMVADVVDGRLKNIEILVDAWHGASGLAWSPDSRFLAYNHADLNFNSEVYIQAVDGGQEPVNVSMHPGRDYSPVWSPDGSKLAFISDRNDDNSDIWFVWLQEDQWLLSEKEREEGYYFDPPAEEKKEDDDEEQDEEVQIDFTRIHDRLTQVTSMTGNESNVLIDEKGETFYFTTYSAVDKGSDLHQVKYNGDDLKQVSKGGLSPRNLQWDADHKKIYFLSRGKLKSIDPSNGKTTAYPHEAKMKIDHRAERQQVFDEAWRTLEQGFYDPDFHGEDWTALRNKYRPWALDASTAQDFRFVYNLMLGRLNASHMGLYGGNPEEAQRTRTGLLGLEFQTTDQGVEVSRVVPYAPADRPRNRIEKGDQILAINGKEIGPADNVFAFLEDANEEQVLFKIDGANGEREVVVRPGSSLSTLLYEEWVRERQKLTEEYSNGRLGYIHIRGMNKPSFERFERELMASGYGKEGIVIDVRFNGGGWTTDYLMTVLNVKQHAYTVPRGATDDLSKHPEFSEYYPYSERLPLSAWTKPSIALCNEASYSNAEIFSHAYKNLGIGTLVGQPTFGAVISTGGRSLLDGSFVRLPFRGWYVKATGQNMENGPAVPDILVEEVPGEKAAMSDQQLKTAVEALLEQIDNQ